MQSLAALLLIVQPAPEPDPIVVTARGRSDEPEDAILSTIILDRDRLSQSATERFEEVLADVPALQQFRRADSRSVHPTAQGLSMRGLGGNAAGRVLVVLDGVPQSDPFGGWIAMPSLVPDRLASLKVTEGGGDVDWGPGTLTGTIEATSLPPGGTNGIGGALSAGSRDAWDARALLDESWSGGGLTLGIAHARGDGFVPVVREDRGPADIPADYRQSSLMARARVPVETLNADMILHLFDDRRSRGTAFSDNRNRGANLSFGLSPADAPDWSLLAYHQWRRFESEFASVAPGRSAANPASDQYSVPSDGSGLKALWQVPMAGSTRLRFIAEARRVDGETRERFAFVGGQATRERRAGGDALTLGVGSEIEGQDGPLSWTVSGRVDHWRIGDGHLRERLLAGAAILTDARFDDRSGWQPTARAGLAFQAASAISLRTAAYRGWRLPTLNELYRPFRVGADATAANADLKPESLVGVEAGVDWTPTPAFALSLTAFAARIRDAIVNVDLGTGPGSFAGVGFVPAGGIYRMRQNVDRIRSQGFEMQARFEKGPWNAGLALAYADPSISADGDAGPLDGKRPSQTARLRGSARLSYARGGWRWNISANRSGDQYDDDANLDRLGPAFSLDSEVEAPLGKRWSLGLRGENLTGHRSLTGINSDGSRERSLPRTFWLSVRRR